MAQQLSNLVVGTKVKFGRHSIEGEPAQEIIWRVVAKSHTGYPDNSVTLWTDRSIDLRAFDAQESGGNSTAVNSGNNAFILSNIGQWLNSTASAGDWYSPTHTYDQPPTDDTTSHGTGYANRPGFLNSFTMNERNAILDTNVFTSSYDGRYESNAIRKVFLPSVTELTGSASLAEGAHWGNFGLVPGLLTQHAYDNTRTKQKPNSVSEYWEYWTRSLVPASFSAVQVMTISGTTMNRSAYVGSVGVRPVVNLPSALSISDTTDSDGCYTFIWNVAPSAPTTLYANTIHGGRSNPISWTKVTDPDGDEVTYLLECSIDGGEYAQIYSGTALSYAHLVPFGTSTVSYRVKATDPSGESSEYTNSATITVINNNAPVISGTDYDMGVKSSGFTTKYTITDANSDAVTVSESIDGVQIRALVATLGEEITCGVTENTWLALPNGSHTLTIRATDGIDTSVRTYTFTKLVETLTIQNATPWLSTTMPTRIMLVITRNIPSGATFKVEVCNNGYDVSPAWEDCTDAVKSGLVHVFTNTEAQDGGRWGVLVRVTVERNGATGACYVSAIGGNFE